MTTTEQLVAVLDAAGVLPASWRETFLAVPRHAFLPAKCWVDDGESAPQPINRDTDPGRWLESAYTDVTIVTQFDDGVTEWPAIGTYRTSSASDPSMVATMLDCLDVQPDQRILEIGTGTGYNAALLAHRLGASQVTTIEIDPLIAAAANEALDAAGFRFAVDGDGGATGHPISAVGSCRCASNALHMPIFPAWISTVARRPKPRPSRGWSRTASMCGGPSAPASRRADGATGHPPPSGPSTSSGSPITQPDHGRCPV